MVILATPQSLKSARRLLDEIAIKGNLKISSHNEFSPVYSNGTEKFWVEKKSQRQWRVVKDNIEKEV